MDKIIRNRNSCHPAPLNLAKPAENNSFLIISILFLLSALMLLFFTLNINDLMTGAICIWTGLFLAYLFKRKYRDWLNPATILSIVWICVFGLSYFGDIVARYETGSVYAYGKPSEWSILLVFVSYALFVFGVLITCKRKMILGCRKDSFLEMFRKSCNLQFFKMTTIILFIIGLSFYIFFLYKNEWIIPILAGMPRGRIQLPVLGYFSMLLRVTLVLGVVHCCILYRSKGRISKLMLAISLVSMLTLFTNVQRMDVMTSLIMIVMSIYYLMDKKVKMWFILVILLFLFSTFYGLLYLRAKALGFERNWMLQTYKDTGASFRHLSYILETETPDYSPLMTVQFLDAFFEHRLRMEAMQRHSNIFYGKGNISTYLAWIYLDFGVAGFLIISFILGVITGLGYTYMITRPNIFTFFVYTILAVGVFATYRQFKFTATTEIVFYPVVGYLVYWVTKVRYKR